MYKTIQDPYCYEGTDVLKNRLSIRDSQALAEAESILSQHRIVEIYMYQPVVGRFGFAYLCNLHRYIFQDVYEWAGAIREIRIAKGLSAFAYPEHIKSEARRIFDRLKNEKNLRGLNRADFLGRSAWYIGEINALHPFREGNGRALRIFFWLLGKNAGWEIRFEDMEAQEWLNACITAHAGNYQAMEMLLDRIIDKAEE